MKHSLKWRNHFLVKDYIMRKRQLLLSLKMFSLNLTLRIPKFILTLRLEVKKKVE